MQNWSIVDPSIVPAIWADIRDFLQDAVDYAGAGETAEAVGHRIVQGDMQLWVLCDSSGEKLVSAATTSIENYGDMRIMVFNLYGGILCEGWDGLVDAVEDMAQEYGCHHLEISGRPGWERILKDRGYKKHIVVLRKPVETKVNVQEE